MGRYTAANTEALGVYKRLSALAPNDSSALLRYAQAAEGAQDFKTAAAVYATFVKRYPDDPLAADARKKITQLKQQAAQQPSSVQSPTG